jgi:hypothetical protein
MEKEIAQLNTDPTQWDGFAHEVGIPAVKVQVEVRRQLNELAQATAAGTMPKLLPGEKAMLAAAWLNAKCRRLTTVECINVEAVRARLRRN